MFHRNASIIGWFPDGVQVNIIFRHHKFRRSFTAFWHRIFGIAAVRIPVPAGKFITVSDRKLTVIHLNVFPSCVLYDIREIISSFIRMINNRIFGFLLDDAVYMPFAAGYFNHVPSHILGFRIEAVTGFTSRSLDGRICRYSAQIRFHSIEIVVNSHSNFNGSCHARCFREIIFFFILGRFRLDHSVFTHVVLRFYRAFGFRINPSCIEISIFFQSAVCDLRSKYISRRCASHNPACKNFLLIAVFQTNDRCGRKFYRSVGRNRNYMSQFFIFQIPALILVGIEGSLVRPNGIIGCIVVHAYNCPRQYHVITVGGP